MSLRTSDEPERVAVVGSGAIACGLAGTVAAKLGGVVVLARSDGSAARAAERAAKAAAKLGSEGSVRVTTDAGDLSDATFVVEAVVEDPGVKGKLLAELGGVLPEAAVLATTTSSLRVGELAAASGRPDRFVGLHVFNPVPRMELVELAYAPEATGATRRRAQALCESLGKTPVEVPDTPGFVVNRLLFPYLFEAVRLMEAGGLEPEAVDTCMRLGAGHPMGPLALLDFVGLDVAAAIGDSIGVEVPARVRELVAEGAVGRKAGRGFYAY